MHLTFFKLKSNTNNTHLVFYLVKNIFMIAWVFKKQKVICKILSLSESVKVLDLQIFKIGSLSPKIYNLYESILHIFGSKSPIFRVQ